MPRPIERLRSALIAAALSCCVISCAHSRASTFLPRPGVLRWHRGDARTGAPYIQRRVFRGQTFAVEVDVASLRASAPNFFGVDFDGADKGCRVLGEVHGATVLEVVDSGALVQDGEVVLPDGPFEVGKRWIESTRKGCVGFGEIIATTDNSVTVATSVTCGLTMHDVELARETWVVHEGLTERRDLGTGERVWGEYEER